MIQQLLTTGIEFTTIFGLAYIVIGLATNYQRWEPNGNTFDTSQPEVDSETTEATVEVVIVDNENPTPVTGRDLEAGREALTRAREYCRRKKVVLNTRPFKPTLVNAPGGQLVSIA